MSIRGPYVEFRIPLADLRLLAFDRIDEIVARGYQAARERVMDWQRERAR